MPESLSALLGLKIVFACGFLAAVWSLRGTVEAIEKAAYERGRRAGRTQARDSAQYSAASPCPCGATPRPTAAPARSLRVARLSKTPSARYSRRLRYSSSPGE